VEEQVYGQRRGDPEFILSVFAEAIFAFELIAVRK